MLLRFLSARAVLFASSCFLLAGVPALADTFNFTIGGVAGTQYPLTGSGTLTTTDAGNGSQYITGITGTIDNSANTNVPGNFAVSLIPTTAPGVVSTVSYAAQNNSTFSFTYDNLLFPSSTAPFDGNGLAFMANGVAYNIGFSGEQALYLGLRPNDINFDQHTFMGVPITFAITPAATGVTPEPSSIALLGTGLLGAAGVLRRRFAA